MGIKHHLAIGVACGAVLAIAGFMYRTSIAGFFWYTLHAPGIALAFESDDALLAMKIGNYYFGTTYTLSKAETAYRKAIAIDPTLAFVHYQLARVLFVESKMTEAAREIDTELRINPSNIRSFYMQGLIRAYSKNLSGAEESFKKFVQVAPTEWAGYNDLAWVLAEQKKYAEAETLLQAALLKVSGADQNPWLLNNLGVQQLNLREYSAAVVSFTHAASLAATLTEEAWHRAYPGNSSASSADGIAQFKAAIEQNLATARQGR